MTILLLIFFFFFFTDTATTEIYTLFLHDALPISRSPTTAWEWLEETGEVIQRPRICLECMLEEGAEEGRRSEEHTSELQSLTNLVCRLLLEKKKKKNK